MTVAGINQTQYFHSPQPGQRGDDLGKEAFLNLFIAQLRHQDPLNPMENTEFLSQLSQFSSLEQLWNINETMQRSTELNHSLHNLLMTQMIGKEAKVLADTLVLDGNSVPETVFNLSAPGNVKVRIYNDNGGLVKEVDLNFRTDGEQSFQWDGTNQAGTAMESGEYQIVVKALNPDGSEKDLPVFLKGRITGMEFNDGFPMLFMGKQPVNPAMILAVYDSKA